MAGSKKEKHYANSRARRQSDVIITHGKKSKKEKDTDTDSVSSSTNSSADTVVIVPPPAEKKCPLRFMLAGMMEPEADQKKTSGCPLRRVQLWHVIPLCLLAVVNLVLVIVALLGLAGYRVTIGVQGVLLNLVKPDLDCNPLESLADTDDGATLVDKH
ncbi:hypothetical protein D0Z07_3625 [Hyphodiscus hymeniophilus]|uniref:Uncharacterized protein n=1 Tax=Hyphodiscus hymeniophilus TaxID=353542 RepID=A0A9P6VL59_9HELO|nr:hypothetical protein D0Z07_3625 [Hyphodiscus hymeniophilus]